MPSFDDLKKNLNVSKGKESADEIRSSGNAIIKVSKKDKSIIEVEDETLEGAIMEACSYFNTHRDNLKMKITQKGTKGVLGVGKKNFIVIFKFYETGAEMNAPKDGIVYSQVRKDGVYVKVVQGINGGKQVTEDFVAKVLVERKIREYDREKIKESVETKNDEWVKICGPIKSNPDWNSKPKLDISKDDMQAILTITPPILNGKIIEKDEIIDLLKQNSITYGIADDEINDAIEHCIYNKPIIVAEGKKPVDGEDARIEFKFKINPENDIELKEDQFGKVDYFNVVGLIQNVVEDQVLAIKIPPTRGQAGMTIKGTPVNAKDGEDIPMPAGKNTKISDNGMEVISMMQGQAVYNEGLISVEPVFTVNGNVDLKTGKIVFLGTVIITGDVEDGFGVKATQNIEIGGTVGKCEIEAEGNIVIKGGIQGKSAVKGGQQEQPIEEQESQVEGYVKAGKNIYAKFINSSLVKAEGDVIVTDAIFHSKVTAGNRIICLGKKGRIIGGKLVASKEINAKEIGSRNSSTQTDIEVGTDPEAKEKLNMFDVELKEKEEQIRKMKQNIEQLNKQREQNKGILPPDKEVLLQKFMLALNEHIAVVDEIKEDIADLRSYLDDIKTSGKVSVKEYIYPGVRIFIKDCSKIIERENQYVTYILEGGEIRDIQYQDISKDLREQVAKDLSEKKKK